MNTTTTDVSAHATTNPQSRACKAMPGERRMAREAGSPAAPGTANTPDKPQAAAAPARAPSKIASVIALLGREQGATLTEMVEAAGWLPHTTRAALTGLKKKGHTLTKDKRDDVTCYRIVKAG